MKDTPLQHMPDGTFRVIDVPISRRERIATALLAGYLAEGRSSCYSVAGNVKRAIEMADALIKELDK